MTFDQLGAALAGKFENVHHYLAPPKAKAPWITWAQQSSNGLYAGDHSTDEAQLGAIDLFTLSDPEPLKLQIEQFARDLEIVCDLVSIQHEADTKLTHYTWSVEVC